MLMFLKAVGEAVAAKALKVAAEFVPFGDKIYDIGADVIDRYRKAGREAKIVADAQAAIQAGMDQVRADARQIAREVAAGQSDEVIDLVETYLTQVPASIQQSLKRSDDPTGTSLPLGFAVSSAEDVARMLPPRVPRFRPNMPLPGKAGWTLDRLLGVGGFGEVWFARHDRMASLTGAVKFCFGQTGRDLIHEADLIDRVMQAGSHPNIVPLKDVCLDGDAPWLMFEYIAGGTLTDWIHALAGKPNEERLPQVLAAIRQLTDAVAFFHAQDRPLVHRDLKPSNILLDRATKKLRITDFGIGAVTARETNRQESRDESSRGGRLLSYLHGSHTPIYSSPQQRAGVAPDPRDDIHALGVIAYQMLTGKLDSGPGTGATRALKRMGVADDLAELLLRCASEELEDRPKNASEFRAELAALVPSKRRDVIPPVMPAPPLQNEAAPPVKPIVPAVPKLKLPPPVVPARKAGERHQITLPGGVTMAFAWCPPGTFLMGSPESEEGRQCDETQHEVTLTKGFWMGIHPVTQAQYQAIMSVNPSYFKGDTLPVETVRWGEAVAFCQAMTAATGTEVRLPTEAEWEFAPRGGTITPFYWGTKLNGTQANCAGSHPYGTTIAGPYLGKTTPVGNYAGEYPHQWGLMDVAGNVFEWCSDWYGPYPVGAEVDPTGRDEGGVEHVYRGGGFRNSATRCRSAYRGGRMSTITNIGMSFWRQSFSLRGYNLGFRVAAVQSGQ